MAIKLLQGTEDVPLLQNQIDDDNGSWWGGVQLAGASLVVAASLIASAAFTTQLAESVAEQHQDDPAGSLANLKIEEDYWQYRLPSKTDYFVATQYDTPEAVSQSTFAPDEDVWNSPQPWQFAAVSQPTYWQDEVANVSEEGDWQQAAPSQTTRVIQPWFDQDEVFSALTPLDEDYWFNLSGVQNPNYVLSPMWNYDGDPTVTPIVVASTSGTDPEIHLFKLSFDNKMHKL